MKTDSNFKISCLLLMFLCLLQMFEFYERVSGARMHAAYVRPGGVHQVSTLEFKNLLISYWGPNWVDNWKAELNPGYCVCCRICPWDLWTIFMSGVRTSQYASMRWRRYVHQWAFQIVALVVNWLLACRFQVLTSCSFLKMLLISMKPF